MNFVDAWNISDSTSSTTTISGENAPPAANDTIVDIASLEFEDNFIPQQTTPLNPREPQDNRLPDSDNYLAALEKRLHRLRNNPSVLQQLAERREACMQLLLGGNVALRTEADLELEATVTSNELLRFIRPEQALSQAEVVQLVQHDHLQLEADEHEEVREGEESGTESSTSR